MASDDDAILAYVRAHPGVGAEEIRRETELDHNAVFVGLLHLRAKDRITKAGDKRATKYTATKG